jgi:hypothetical protein
MGESIIKKQIAIILTNPERVADIIRANDFIFQ